MDGEEMRAAAEQGVYHALTYLVAHLVAGELADGEESEKELEHPEVVVDRAHELLMAIHSRQVEWKEPG